jgi:hypothetical protein
MAFMANVAKTSATSVTGRQRGSRGGRPGKPFAGVSGDRLAQRVTGNMRSIARMITTVTETDRIPSDWSVRKFVGSAIHRIHHGLPNAKKLKKLRSHETNHAYGCLAEDVPARWEAFLNELQEKIDRKDNPQQVCAWVEYELRFEIHPLADGSGRLATALVAWIMLYYGERIPNYSFFERSEMHAKLRGGRNAFEVYYLETCFQHGEAVDETDPFPDSAITAVAS